jgi:uncharacterized membrane protein
MHYVRRLAHHHPRLLIATLVGVIVGLALPPQWPWITRTLVAWNVGVWSYLIAIGWLIVNAKPKQIFRLAEQEESSAVAVLVVLSTAAVASLAAIFFELAAARNLSPDQRLDHYAFTAATLLGSWFLVGILFTFHYAYLYYRSSSEHRPLAFPDHEPQPDYWDFLYFSFTIAVAAQTSDVAVMSRAIRRVALVQSVLSFFFNAAILGLSINIAAGLIGG